MVQRYYAAYSPKHITEHFLSRAMWLSMRWFPGLVCTHLSLLVSLQDFFETCAMLITVVILGKYMECQAKGKTSEAIQVGPTCTTCMLVVDVSIVIRCCVGVIRGAQ